MALKDILDRIERESRAEAETIRKEAEERAATIRKEAEMSAAKLAEDLKRRNEDRAESERLRRINMARLENRKRILAEQRRAIDAVFDAVREKMKRLEGEDFENLAVTLLKRSKPDGDEEIIVPKADRAKYTPNLLAAMNEAVGGGSLRFAEETGDFEGGFILRKGARKDDLSFRRVFGGLREELEPKIVGALFGNEGGA